MSHILPIVELGDPVLFRKAKPVKNISAVLPLVNNMIATLIDQVGLGLAAPQVGVSQRLYLSWVSPPDPANITVFINPVLTYLPSPKQVEIEGCLSIPGIRGHVSRYRDVQVQYYDQYNTQHTQRFSGLAARVIQHEHDHIDGVLFLDRIKSTRDMMTETVYDSLR